MTTQIHTDHDRDARGAISSRRAVLRTGAWTVPVIAMASTAPAFAASLAAITGVQVVSRTSTGLSSSGSVTNGSATTQTVTADWLWTCDATGPGAGSFTGGTATRNGWNLTLFTFVASGGNGSRGIRLVGNQTISAGATVVLPQVTLNLSASTVSGTATLTLSAPAPAVVVQPTPTSWTAYTAPGPAPAPRKATAPMPGTVTLTR